MTNTDKSWQKFLHPETLKGNLIHIALFISAFEMFKDIIIEKPKTFFSNGFNQDGLILSDSYKTEVLSKSKSPLYASLLWFKDIGAIEEEDIEIFNAIKKHRNEVTHELIGFVSDSKKEFDTEQFKNLIDLLSKIEKWWLINFEIAINPDMMPEDANIDEVIPGPIWTLQLMLDISLGGEPEEGYYYNAFNQKNT